MRRLVEAEGAFDLGDDGRIQALCAAIGADRPAAIDLAALAAWRWAHAPRRRPRR